jgi:crotonobetainyl-CoA:carnitine CoA-transferase CaiB-like acyl-CoA transferase
MLEPHTTARQMIVETEHPHYGTVRQLASPVRVGNQPVTYRRAPRRHEDAPYILETLLGYDADRVRALRTAGAFGMPQE